MAPAPDVPAAAPVRKRLVCFLSGFDPRGPGHYHALYREMATAQSLLTGQGVTVGPRTTVGAHVASWAVHAKAGAGSTATRYDFLRWDDLVRRHWAQGWLGAGRSAAFASWQLWWGGVMWRAFKTSWPSFVVMAAPGLLLLAGGLLVAVAVVSAVALHGVAWAVALACLLVGATSLVTLVRYTDQRMHMGWLVRSMASLVHQGQGQTPELEDRLDTFAAHVYQARVGGEFDEVLVVGHSSGAMMAMSVMARAVRLGAAAVDATVPDSLSLLTLGHCAPVLAEQTGATRFRADLATLVATPALVWVDYGAPPDGCCFPLVDPTAAVAAGALSPKLLNPRFASLFTPKGYRQLRADHFRCHFQYLMAGELAGDYDYLGMTAGPESLAQRHRRRVSVTNYHRFQAPRGRAST